MKENVSLLKICEQNLTTFTLKVKKIIHLFAFSATTFHPYPLKLIYVLLKSMKSQDCKVQKVYFENTQKVKCK